MQKKLLIYGDDWRNRRKRGNLSNSLKLLFKLWFNFDYPLIIISPNAIWLIHIFNKYLQSMPISLKVVKLFHQTRAETNGSKTEGILLYIQKAIIW